MTDENASPQKTNHTDTRLSLTRSPGQAPPIIECRHHHATSHSPYREIGALGYGFPGAQVPTSNSNLQLNPVVRAAISVSISLLAWV